MKRLVLSIALATSIFSTVSYASTSDDASGVFVEPFIGPFQAGVNTGYQFNQYYAVQGTVADGLGGAYGMYAIAAKGMLPLGRYFSLTGYLGAAYYYNNFNSYGFSSSNSSMIEPLLGVGVAWNFTPHFSATAAIMMFATHLGQLAYIPFGLSYRF